MNSNKYLTDHEYAAVMRIVERYRYTQYRDMLIIELLLKTGARGSELIKMSIGDLNVEQKSVLIHGTKNSNDREIPLNADLFQRTLDWSWNRRHMFNITVRRVRQIWEFYRPRDLNKGIHCLRHTFAIRAYKLTKDIKLVQKALGHKCITNTMVYQDYVYTIEEMRKII